MNIFYSNLIKIIFWLKFSVQWDYTVWSIFFNLKKINPKIKITLMNSNNAGNRLSGYSISNKFY